MLDSAAGAVTSAGDVTPRGIKVGGHEKLLPVVTRVGTVLAPPSTMSLTSSDAATPVENGEQSATQRHANSCKIFAESSHRIFIYMYLGFSEFTVNVFI